MTTYICYVWRTFEKVGIKKNIRGVSGYLTLGGQVVMWRVVACRRRPAAPSILPKSGWAIAHPAHLTLTPLFE